MDRATQILSDFEGILLFLRLAGRLFGSALAAETDLKDWFDCYVRDRMPRPSLEPHGE